MIGILQVIYINYLFLICTQKRDLDQVVSKLKVVLLPLGDDSRDTVIQRLRDCK